MRLHSVFANRVPQKAKPPEIRLLLLLLSEGARVGSTHEESLSRIRRLLFPVELDGAQVQAVAGGGVHLGVHQHADEPATHAAQVALHLQPARPAQGVPGHREHRSESGDEGAAGEAVGARDRARVLRPAGGPRGRGLVQRQNGGAERAALPREAVPRAGQGGAPEFEGQRGPRFAGGGLPQPHLRGLRHRREGAGNRGTIAKTEKRNKKTKQK
eukprot:1194250-Prorocentrum_minimum.AAC.6